MHDIIRKYIKESCIELTDIEELLDVTRESYDLDLVFLAENEQYKYQSCYTYVSVRPDSRIRLYRELDIPKDAYQKLIQRYITEGVCEGPLYTLNAEYKGSILHRGFVIDGEYYGTLGFRSEEDRVWTAEEKRVIQELGQIVWIYLSQKRLNQNQKYRESHLMAEVKKTTLSCRYVDLLTGKSHGFYVPDGSGGMVPEWSDYTTTLHFLADRFLDEPQRTRLKEQFSIANLNRIFAEDNNSVSMEFSKDMQNKVIWRRVTAKLVDLTADQKPFHVCVVVDDISEVKEKEQRLQSVQDALKKAEQNSQLRTYQATHDQLTGVLNRNAFAELIYNNHLKDMPLGFLLIDLDRFKEINDEHGHIMGDRALKSVSEQIKTSFQGKDQIIRLGGDEFAVLLLDCGPESWESICNRISMIHTKLKGMLPMNEPITLSCGICFSDCGYHTDMYKLADKALYRTKSNGRAGCSWISRDGKIQKEWHDDAVKIQEAYEKNFIGTWELDLFADGRPDRLRVDETLREVTGVDANVSAEELYKFWKSRIPEEYLSVIQKSKEAIFLKGRVESTYKWQHPQYGLTLIRTTATIAERTNQHIRVIGYYKDLRDTEMVE